MNPETPFLTPALSQPPRHQLSAGSGQTWTQLSFKSHTNILPLYPHNPIPKGIIPKEWKSSLNKVSAFYLTAGNEGSYESSSWALVSGTALCRADWEDHCNVRKPWWSQNCTGQETGCEALFYVPGKGWRGTGGKRKPKRPLTGFGIVDDSFSDF